MERKINKDKKVYSHLERYIKNLWIVTAVSFFIAILLCIKLGIAPPPIMLLIAGIATTTSGLLIKIQASYNWRYYIFYIQYCYNICVK